MVDLAKIRKKARKKAENRQPATGNPPEALALTPETKLARFLAEAGKERFVPQMPPSTGGDEVELLTFVLGKERYAIEIDRIVQIIAARPVTSVPNAAPGVVGIVSLRGSMVALIDVRSKLHQPVREGEQEARIIVIEEPGGLIGFEVDRVLRPARIPREAIEPQPVVAPAEESEAIRGVIREEDALTIVLDLVKLLE